jgi:hypothetical protein
MAYFSLHAYDADVWLPGFLGLRQEDESLNGDPRYATEVLNVETPNGVLQPHAGFEEIQGEFDARVETIARFYRRWYQGTGSKHWLVCAAGGNLYYKQEGARAGWMKIERPALAPEFNSNVWSWCTYEVNIPGVDHPIDVLLMSNAEDGMIMVTPPDRPRIWGDLQEYTWQELGEMTWAEAYSPAWNISYIDTKGKKFGIIERYAERIWGGAIPGDPDMLMYSAPYDPTDWEQNEEIPEDGAGSVQQPSWDGDSFTALRAFGDQLIAFKEHRVWRILGTNPGEYAFKEQYGGGAPFFNTICVDVERIYMADINGLSAYDGMSVSPYSRKLIEKIWRTINKDAMDQMCAVLFQHRYYLAAPVGDSTVNNALFILNLEEGTILYYEDMKIESMLATPETIYATSSTLPGKVLILGYDSWITGKASGGATKWVSPWMDFGYKRIVKGGFDLYFTPEVKTEAVTLTFRIQTEKKLKSKTYTVQPLTDAQKEANKEYRNKRLHFSGNGRRFRIIIETAEGNTAPWRLIGGLHMVVETDPD